MFIKAEKIISWNNPVMMFVIYACILLISWFGAQFIVGEHPHHRRADLTVQLHHERADGSDDAFDDLRYDHHVGGERTPYLRGAQRKVRHHQPGEPRYGDHGRLPSTSTMSTSHTSTSRISSRRRNPTLTAARRYSMISTCIYIPARPSES